MNLKCLSSALHEYDMEIDPSFLNKNLKNPSIVVIDLRLEHELAAGIIPGAKRLESKDLASKIKILSKNRQSIILYCQSGKRSLKLTEILAPELGDKVKSLKGGISNWIHSGFETEKVFAFKEKEIERYERHFSLKEIGPKGQAKLLKSKVLIIGSGGLGSPIAFYLAAAGVGTIGLVDFDRVSRSNLQRQILFNDGDVGSFKVDIAKKRVLNLNPDIRVNAYNQNFSSENAFSIIENYDLVVDASDNFKTRYLVNDACFFLAKPLVYGSIYKFQGQVSIFEKNHGPCYRCLFPEPPDSEEAPDCNEAGVLGVLPGVIGTLQSTEAIKRLLKLGTSLHQKLLLYDALNMGFRKIDLKQNKECELCGDHPKIKNLIDYETFCRGV